jgi:hypothetical protein
MIAFERHNIDITFLIMKQRSELWNNARNYETTLGIMKQRSE